MKRSLLKILLGLLVPLALMLIGVALVVFGRWFGSDLMRLAGLIIAAAGILWTVVSCIRHGINPFDP